MPPSRPRLTCYGHARPPARRAAQKVEPMPHTSRMTSHMMGVRHRRDEGQCISVPASPSRAGLCFPQQMVCVCFADGRMHRSDSRTHPPLHRHLDREHAARPQRRQAQRCAWGKRTGLRRFRSWARGPRGCACEMWCGGEKGGRCVLALSTAGERGRGIGRAADLGRDGRVDRRRGLVERRGRVDQAQGQAADHGPHFSWGASACLRKKCFQTTLMSILAFKIQVYPSAALQNFCFQLELPVALRIFRIHGRETSPGNASTHRHDQRLTDPQRGRRRTRAVAFPATS
jgi:hypothetical protein